MKLKISPGNTKTGKIPAISLPPVRSCMANAPCAKTCYALKSYRMYKNTRLAWDSNLNLWHNNPTNFMFDLEIYLVKKAPKFFRWHVSGDIADYNYLKMMINTAVLFPNIKFLAFTKRYDFVNKYMDKTGSIPKNLSIVFSAWPGLIFSNPFNFPVAYMQDGTETRVNNALECPGNCETCGMCWNLKNINKNVVFKKH